MGRLLDAGDIEQAVRKAGFTPGPLRAIAQGRLDQRSAKPVLEVHVGAGLLVLEGPKVRELERTFARGMAVEVWGTLHHEAPRGHGEHPDRLVVEGFRSRPGGPERK
jgi:hypothetical protein